MKAKHKTHTRHHSHSGFKQSKEFEFESLATELDLLTKSKLPDGCLDGVLRGHEAEIRQDAILLALRWYSKSNEKEAWHAPRSAAHALRFTKMRYARRMSKRPPHTELHDDAIPSDLIQHNPRANLMSERPHALQMASEAISEAAKSERITPANAAIVLMILQDGLSVVAIAKKLGLTRGAVYQHINRVRATLPTILANIEEPGFPRNSMQSAFVNPSEPT